ncbi:hypothetical protein KOR34_53370 [Posidoniimonas corsicana]|uniref:5-bromo-4-chloroindolyl phosphate hydrolysis protein n=1 Tax=Posidoniimonas corsicana TaxID=1938618 RepID=A0A5C5UU55_9BACT|nr:hypothetical protein [Posidoniimonas corsicana]TWT29197.1 hypothetical protein KOR34_53370 [Posidoniimonas corsicana]
MDDVKKKVLLDLFVSPWTLAPIVGGLSALLVSWGMDGNTALSLFGVGSVLTGLGIQATRLIMGVEELTEKAHGYLTEKEKREQTEKLDQLAARLSQDDDPRTEECLRRLRSLYGSLEADPPTGHTAVAFRQKVDKLFHAAVRQLQRSLELWEKAKRLPVGTGRPLLDERKKAVNEVVLTVNHLASTVEQFHAYQLKDTDDELATLREELGKTIEAARRADEVIDSLDSPTMYDKAEFES